MPGKFIYLDHLSTTVPHPDVAAAMAPFWTEQYGLPGGRHRLGLKARTAVEQARQSVAAWLGASSPEEIIFTSGGSESVNLAIKGLAWARQTKGRHIVASVAEHPAVEESLAFLERHGFSCTRVPVDRQGFVSVADVEKAFRPDTILLATHLSNHDSGAIQPVAELAAAARERGIAVFCDGCTGGAWVPLDLPKAGIDLLSLAPHRFFGPKGVGILYRRRGVDLEPLIHGGKQEQGLRAGSAAVACQAAMAVVAQVWQAQAAVWLEKTRRCSEVLWRELSGIPNVCLNGPVVGPTRDPRHLNVSFEFVEAEALALLLDLQGVAVTAHSGCLAPTLKLSPVLKAMGVDDSLSLGAVLFSPGPEQQEEDMKEAAQRVAKAVDKVRSMSPAWAEYKAGRVASKIARG